MLDVDGVLVDGRPSDGRRWDHSLFEDLGVSSQALVSEFFAADWSSIVVGEKELLPALERTMAKIAPSVKATDLVDYWFRMDSRIVEAVLADCRRLRRMGVPIYLATNQERMRARYLMEDMQLSQEVNGIVFSGQLGFRKPQAEFFRRAAKAIGHDPDQLLLIDDTIANVDRARAAGWQAVHWDGSSTLLEIVEGFIRL